jgi:pimeloyl-ACP methyl ester carboxylesterase
MSSTVKRGFRIAVSRGLDVVGDVRVPSEGTDLPVLAFLNGFLLRRDWGFYPFLADRLAEKGFVVVTFDPGAGEEGRSPERATIGDILGDLGAIVGAVESGSLPEMDRAAREGIGLVGHSVGGAVALLYARKDRRVRGIVTLAGFSTLERFGAEATEQLEREGFVEVPEPSGGLARLPKSFLDDLARHREGYSVETAVRGLRIPVAFVHGEEDHVVGVKEGELLYHWSDKDRSRLIVFEKTGHTFGAVDPFRSTNPDLERLLRILETFFGKHLAPASRT